MKDEKLLDLLRSDPDSGIDRLIRQYSGLVFSVVRARLSEICDSSEVEDCVTDVFLNFYNSSGTFEPNVSLKNYLTVIARNTACKYARRRPAQAPLPTEELMFDIPDESDMAEEAVKNGLLESILREIRKMGRPDSDILIKKYYLGQSSKAIASELGMSVSNVDTRAHRAIEKLKHKFGGKS